jgi:DNA-3-methyladenine glycosylase II
VIPLQLTPGIYQAGLDWLAKNDDDLGRVLSRFGPPPMWNREPGFATLLQIILEQQVSLASARAAFLRLLSAVSHLSAAEFLKLDDQRLKQIGFSRQKIRYARILAQKVLTEQIQLGELSSLSDDEVRTELQKITGIGRWTADIYLLMALRRPDIWPAGDLALIRAAQEVKKLESRPSTEEFAKLGEKWKPWRAVAARILWHHYLSN